jgi:hypothetical protein
LYYKWGPLSRKRSLRRALRGGVNFSRIFHCRRARITCFFMRLVRAKKRRGSMRETKRAAAGFGRLPQPGERRLLR